MEKKRYWELEEETLIFKFRRTPFGRGKTGKTDYVMYDVSETDSVSILREVLN
jgi:hypothetical protein